MPSQIVDLVMWTKNGSAVLPRVLKRVEEAIPPSHVRQKILVDDHSTDSTVEIARAFNWKVYENPSAGISTGANEALRHVEASRFISLEQDLLLAKEWWGQVPRYLESPKVAVASGMRFASQPRPLRSLQLFVAKKYRAESNLASYLRGREPLAFTLGKTLDNTVYRTDVMRKIGGFPKASNVAGVDTTLAYVLEKYGYNWHVDHTVHSTHLRRGFRDELRHQKWYGVQLHAIFRMVEEISGRPPPLTLRVLVNRAVMSPATGLFMAWKTREPMLVLYHPLIKLYYLRGYLEGRAQSSG